MEDLEKRIKELEDKVSVLEFRKNVFEVDVRPGQWYPAPDAVENS